MSKPVLVLLIARTSWKGVCLIMGFLWESFPTMLADSWASK